MSFFMSQLLSSQNKSEENAQIYTISEFICISLLITHNYVAKIIKMEGQYDEKPILRNGAKNQNTP